MADLAFVALLVALFALALLFVRACDRIVEVEGRSTSSVVVPPVTDSDRRQAADADPTRSVA